MAGGGDGWRRRLEPVRRFLEITQFSQHLHLAEQRPDAERACTRWAGEGDALSRTPSSIARPSDASEVPRSIDKSAHFQ